MGLAVGALPLFPAGCYAYDMYMYCILPNMDVDIVPAEGGDLDSATTGTWAGKIPASLLPSVPPTSAHSPSTTTTKSPEKSKATTDDTASEREVGTCIVDDHYQSEYIPCLF